MENPDRDAWVMDEDLVWRPPVAPLPLDWDHLKRAWDYRLEVGSVSYKTGSQTDSDLWYETHQWVMALAFAMLGHSIRPKFKSWLGLRESKWKREHWLKMLSWEFSQWKWRISEKAGHSNARTINTLLRRIPEVTAASPPVLLLGGILPMHDDSQELEIAWRWLVARGRCLSARDWSDFQV